MEAIAPSAVCPSEVQVGIDYHTAGPDRTNASTAASASCASYNSVAYFEIVSSCARRLCGVSRRQAQVELSLQPRAFLNHAFVWRVLPINKDWIFALRISFNLPHGGAPNMSAEIAGEIELRRSFPL